MLFGVIGRDQPCTLRCLDRDLSKVPFLFKDWQFLHRYKRKKKPTQNNSRASANHGL